MPRNIETAPEADCDCNACRAMRRAFDRKLGYRSDGSVALDADLEANYLDYLSGALVPSGERD